MKLLDTAVIATREPIGFSSAIVIRCKTTVLTETRVVQKQEQQDVHGCSAGGCNFRPRCNTSPVQVTPDAVWLVPQVAPAAAETEKPTEAVAEEAVPAPAPVESNWWDTPVETAAVGIRPFVTHPLPHTTTNQTTALL